MIEAHERLQAAIVEADKKAVALLKKGERVEGILTHLRDAREGVAARVRDYRRMERAAKAQRQPEGSPRRDAQDDPRDAGAIDVSPETTAPSAQGETSIQ